MPALNQIHCEKGRFVDHVDPAQARIELDAIEDAYAAVDKDDVAEMQIAMALAHESSLPACFETVGQVLAAALCPFRKRASAVRSASLSISGCNCSKFCSAGTNDLASCCRNRFLAKRAASPSGIRRPGRRLRR